MDFETSLRHLSKMAAELVAQAQTYDEVRAATYIQGQISLTKIQLKDGYDRY